MRLGLQGPAEQLYYRQVFLDTALLARIVMDMPEVDPARVGAYGGSQGGGASLTPHGEEVLSHYEKMQADVSRVTDSYEARLSGWLRDAPAEAEHVQGE